MSKVSAFCSSPTPHPLHTHNNNNNNNNNKILLKNSGLGFIVANLPGLLVGGLAGNKLGAIRDAKGWLRSLSDDVLAC